MKNSPESKKGRILKYLQDGKAITPQIALSLFGSFRLAVVINRLRNEGFNISTTMKTTLFNELYGEYKLVKP